MVLSFLEQVCYSQNIEMREKNIEFMPYWEVMLDDKKEVLGRYNQKYFSEQNIGELVKKMYEQEIRQGHNLSIRLSKKD